MIRTTPERGQEDSEAWEQAYLRFETPAEEIRKFVRRLRAAGADGWRRDAVILDLFSGRGGGAVALHELGFRCVISVDLSARLMRAREEVRECCVADCRMLPVAAGSVDIAVVHGGLHHLRRLPEDLAMTLSEVARVLRPNGVFLAVEPWHTPFLTLVHWICGLPLVRRHRRVDALATMIRLESPTYEAWLNNGREILAALDRYFERRNLRIRLGKLRYLGVTR